MFICLSKLSCSCVYMIIFVKMSIYSSGQHFRLSGEFSKALPYLKKAAVLPIPNRSLFQWHYLYNCLSKMELGRAVQAMKAGEVHI